MTEEQKAEHEYNVSDATPSVPHGDMRIPDGAYLNIPRSIIYVDNGVLRVLGGFNTIEGMAELRHREL